MVEIAIINSDQKSAKVDAFIGCVGYEQRSVNLLREVVNSTVIETFIFDYQSKNLFSYEENIKYVRGKSENVFNDFNVFISKLDDFITRAQKPNLMLDVTSFDRVKIASILSAIFKRSAELGRISICYCPSKFNEPKLAFDVVNAFGPVIPEFLGNNVYGREGLALIVGAGFEFGRIVGAIDTLEPDRVLCFTPYGLDKRFETSMMVANLNFDFVGNADALIPYNILDTSSLYYTLRRIIEHENTRHNVMVLPLGPKIFATISMLIAMILHPNIMVWRHSTANTSRPDSISDATSCGEVIKFEFEFQSDANNLAR